MSDLKQVKVDNWGIYFLQRLKHFFNRTDYCDLTLQFQDNAQLKVHRLVLNVCTEYFELLERTCEMYEDCLVMPDDLQADVVVPIVNFMYTGQLEFKMDSLEKLYQTSQIMNMPVLTKLLETHRNMRPTPPPLHHYPVARNNAKDTKSQRYSTSSLSNSNKRSYSKAFESNKPTSNQKVIESAKTSINRNIEIPKNKQPSTSKVTQKDRKYYSKDGINNGQSFPSSSPININAEINSKKLALREPRPTRYEVPEELESDNIFDSSFSHLSYESKPLMVHPDATKKYSAKKNILACGSKKFIKGPSTIDIVECKKITKDETLFEDDSIHNTNDEMFQPAHLSIRHETNQNPSQLFDQMINIGEGPKVTIEGKDKHSGNLDHAKIISEVLKKYPHLMKSNRNIKLKILDTPQKLKKIQTKQIEEKVEVKPKSEVCYTYETDVLDSKEAAKLIAMGADNIKGPWICLICGTPGRALNFTSYYNYRRHLVEVHNEKPVSNICEHCGLRTYKRNYLMHHIYTKHGVEPPSQYQFPKCNMCDYVALTENFLAKHKLTHSDNKTALHCSVCGGTFKTASKWLLHIQTTGHKVNANTKLNLSCTYCSKMFLKESNFYVHLKTTHKDEAKRDGVIIDSDEETQFEENTKMSHNIVKNIKYEHPSLDNQCENTDIQIQIHRNTDGNIQINKKQQSNDSSTKHKILNLGFNSSVKQTPKQKRISKPNSDFIQEFDITNEINEGNIVYIDGNDYIVNENQLVLDKSVSQSNEEYIIPEPQYMESDLKSKETPTTSLEFLNNETTIQPTKMVMNKSMNINEPIQIVVSNEEEYKALMSSNNSIIFDENDTNKTLTVLTAPQTIDNPTINLENTQASDMVIIQEDFPLNVSEAVSGDQKYVVVYSHSVTECDPNKEYQIITPQEIEAQYVQGSEVITQNYETVTTSASEINSHIIEAQIEGSWPNQIQGSQSLKINPENSNKNIGIEQNIELNDNDIELPKVQMCTESSQILINNATINQSSSNLGNQDTMNTDQNSSNQVVLENAQNDMCESMDTYIPLKSKTDKEHVISETDNINVENCEKSQIVDDVTLGNDMPVLQQNQQECSDNTDQSKLANIEQNTEEEPPETVQISNNIETVSTEMITQIVTACDNNGSTEQTAPQANTIQSDWSEDEFESIVQESKSTCVNTQLDSTSEVEESIENIQQEMEKQMTSKETIEESNTASEKSKIDDIEKNESHECYENATTSQNVQASKEKITSLLNDWEDNDSPEEESPPNDNAPEAQKADGATEIDESNEVNVEENVNQSHSKNDNIKSLVSDWDEEEEEEIKK